MAKLTKYLSWWGTAFDKHKLVPKSLAYMLEYNYTDANLSFDALKGHDYEVGVRLRDACARADVFLCFANLERRVYGQCEPEEDEGYHLFSDEIERKLVLKTAFDLSGSLIANELPYEETDFIQDEPFEGYEPDEEENYPGMIGIEGTATHIYRKTV